MSIKSASLSLSRQRSNVFKSANTTNAIIGSTVGTASVGSYVQDGQTYDYYVWNASNTITISQAGLVDMLIVGGGGSGGQGALTVGGGSGGGGGAGGYLSITQGYLAAGTVTVTVGAGAAATPAINQVGLNGVTSRVGSFFAGGGEHVMSSAVGSEGDV